MTQSPAPRRPPLEDAPADLRAIATEYHARSLAWTDAAPRYALAYATLLGVDATYRLAESIAALVADVAAPRTAVAPAQAEGAGEFEHYLRGDG